MKRDDLPHAALIAENERLRDALSRIADLTRPEPMMSGPHWPPLGPAQRERIYRLADGVFASISPLESETPSS
jgi:hypothetical protein